ncbi:hypothetical protein CFC21_064133, partial [Triticum aestivum]
GGYLDGEVARRRGGIRLGGQREALEVTGLVLLALRLVVGVEGVGGVAPGVHAVARRAVPQRRAVRVAARVVDLGAEELVEIVPAGLGVERAPRSGQVLHALGRHQHCVSALPAEVHGELGLPVVPEDAPVPLEAAWLHALPVLVHHPEQVRLDVPVRPRRRAAVRRQPLQQPVIEAPRIGRLGVPVAVRGPPHLADNDRHVAVPHCRQRRDQRVEVGVVHVGVHHTVVVHRRRPAVEEGEVQGEVVVEVEAEEGVDVDGEGRLVLGQELDHVRHDAGDLGAEPARRRHGVPGRGVVHVGVERDRRLDPVADAGVVERVLDVLQRRQGDLHERPLVRCQEWLVAHSHVPA